MENHGNTWEIIHNHVNNHVNTWDNNAFFGNTMGKSSEKTGKTIEKLWEISVQKFCRISCFDIRSWDVLVGSVL
jgi:hypothetical protein